MRGWCVPVRLLLTRSRKPAAGHEADSDKWRVASQQREPRVTARYPSLAPSQCPRHSPASFIGGSGEEDEGIFFVGGGATREVTLIPMTSRTWALPATAGENACRGPPSPPRRRKTQFLPACARNRFSLSPGERVGRQAPKERSNKARVVEPQRGKITKPRLADSDVVIEPQRGDLTKPRLKAWVNGTSINRRALKGRPTRSPKPTFTTGGWWGKEMVTGTHVPVQVNIAIMYRPSSNCGRCWPRIAAWRAG